MIDYGFLEPNFQEELIKDYYEEYFGGLYEDLFVNGVELYFPKCRWNEVAFIHTNLNYEDLRIDALVTLLQAFGLPFSRDLKRMDYKQAIEEVGSFEPVPNPNFESVNFLGRLEGLAWCIYLNSDGTLFQVEAHDLELIQENNDESKGDPMPLVECLRKKLASMIGVR